MTKTWFEVKVMLKVSEWIPYGFYYRRYLTCDNTEEDAREFVKDLLGDCPDIMTITISKYEKPTDDLDENCWWDIDENNRIMEMRNAQD